MITIGTDIVHAPRFTAWIDYLPNKLTTIFTAHECATFKARKQTLSHSAMDSTRKNQQLTHFLASRFAAKEAFYKALSQLLHARGTTAHSFSFKACAPHVGVQATDVWQLPHLIIDHDAFTASTGVTLPSLNSQISLAHDHDYAVATVLLSLAID